MKALFVLLIFSITLSQASCLPDSFSLPFSNFLHLSQVEEVAESFSEAVVNELPQGQELIIHLEAMNPKVNASIEKIDNNLVINVLGGFLGHPKLQADVFLLLLCHELGHVLGGPPYKSRNGWSSTEGQADYYSGLICARNLGFDNETFLKAALTLTSIYAEAGFQPKPSLNSCDNSATQRINYGYPSVQCRLDTLIAGWRGQKRPNCWYKED